MSAVRIMRIRKSLRCSPHHRNKDSILPSRPGAVEERVLGFKA
jgi:hypothetical protein